MFWLVVVSCIGWTAAWLDKPYEGGQQYNYKYEIQVVNGVPDRSRTFSLFKITADVNVKSETSETFLCQPENVQIWKFNGRMEELDPTTRQVPVDRLLPLPQEEQSRMIQCLSNEFKFVRDRTVQFFAQPQPHWCTNFQRGIVNTFQLNLQPSKVMSQDDGSSSSIPRNHHMTSYTLMEQSPTGECETRYNIIEQKSETDKSLLKVKKERNFDNCIERPIFEIDNEKSQPCGDCKLQQPLTSTSQVNVIVSGGRSQPVIHSAVIESKHYYTPHSQYLPSVVTVVNQTLTLESQRSMSYLPKTQKLLQPQTLISQIPEQEQQTLELQGFELPTHFYDSQISSRKISKAKESISLLSKYLQSDDREGYTCVMNSVIEIIRNMTLRECQQLLEAIDVSTKYSFTNQNSALYKDRQALLRAFAFAGTPSAVAVITKEIQTQKMSIADSLEILNDCSFHVHKPDAIKKIMDLQNCEYMKDSKFMRTLHITLCECANNMFTAQDSKQKALMKRIELISELQKITGNNDYSSKQLEMQNIIQRMQNARAIIENDLAVMVEKLLASSSFENKTTAFGCLTSSGMQKNIEITRNIIRNPDESRVIQMYAVVSAASSFRRDPQKVTDTLLSIFLDKKYDDYPRIVAFDFLTMFQPSLHIFEAIANAQRKETSPEVASYVYTFMHALSNSTDPCQQSLAKKASLVLNWLKLYEDSYPRYFEKTFFDEALKQGYKFSLKAFSSFRSSVPLAGVISLDKFAKGRKFQHIRVIYSTDNGLDGIIEKLLRTDKLLRKENLQSSFSRSYVQQLKDDLKVRDRLMDSETRGVFIVKIMDRVFLLNHIDLPSMLASLSHKPINVQQSKIFNNVRIILPTESGLPLLYDKKGSGFLHLKGLISSNLKDIFAAKKTSLNVNIIPDLAQQVVTQLGVDATVFKAGIVFKSPLKLENVQISSQISLDRQSQTFKATLDNSQKDDIIAESRDEIETFFKLSPIHASNGDAVPEMRNLIATDHSSIKPFKYTLPGQIFGVKLSLVGEKPECTERVCPWLSHSPLNGRQMTLLKLERETSPSHLQLLIRFSSVDQYTVLSGQVSGAPKTSLNLQDLKQKLKAAELSNSDKYGLSLRLDKVSLQEHWMILESEALCQKTQVGKKRLHCIFSVERAPMWKEESHNWKAHVKADIEYPTERNKMQQLFQRDYIEELNHQLGSYIQMSPLRPEVMKWLKSEHMTIWERIVRNQTYAQSLYNDRSIWQQQPQQQPQKQYQSQPEVRELSQQLDILTSQQRQLMSQLQKLRIIAFSHYPEYLMDQNEISELVRKTEQNIRFVTRQLQQIQIKQRVLQSQQPTDAVEYVLSKLQHAVSRQRRIVDKFEYSHFTSLIKLQQQVQFISQELLKQKQLCQEIQQLLLQIRKHLSGDQIRVKDDKLENVFICQSKRFVLKDVMLRQISVSKNVQKAIKQIHNQPSLLNHNLMVVNVKEALQKIDFITELIVSVIEPVLNKSRDLISSELPYTKEEAKCLASGVSVVSHQEAIIHDVKELIIYCMDKLFKQADPSQRSLLESLKHKHDLLFYETIDLIASIQKAVEKQTRHLYKNIHEKYDLHSTSFKTVDAHISAAFGERSINTLSASIVGSKSMEQLIWEKNQLHSLTRDPRVNELLNLQQTKGTKYYHLLYEIERELNTLRKVNFDIKYNPKWLKQENTALMNDLHSLSAYVVHMFYSQFHTQLLKLNETPNDMCFGWVQVGNDGRKIDATLLKPNQVMTFNNIRTPVLLKYFIPTVSDNLWTPLSSVCTLNDDEIKTFDGQRYLLPNTVSPTCEKVMAIDCTDNSALAVTVHRQYPASNRIVKVVLDSHIIELHPKRYQPLVKMGNDVISLRPLDTVTRIVKYLREQRRVHVTMYDEELVLEVPSIDLVIRCTEHRVTLKPSSFLRERICGLCGNFNRHIADDYQDPSQYIHQSSDSFALSYLRPSQNCDVASYRQLYPIQSTQCRIIYKHDIIDASVDKCISMEPIAICSKGCHRSQQYSRTVKYYCAPRDLVPTTRLVDQVRHRPMYDLLDKDSTFSKTKIFAIKCAPDS